MTFPISSPVCLRARWNEDDPPLLDVGEEEVADINRERVRYAVRTVFASSEKAGRTALDTYAQLVARGEAHARIVNFMLIEGS